MFSCLPVAHRLVRERCFAGRWLPGLPCGGQDFGASGHNLPSGAVFHY